MIIEPGTAITGGVTAAKLAYEHREKAIPLIRKIYHWIRRGTLRVAIFGGGGCGKSTLGEYLSGEFDLKTSSTKYKESLKVENYSLEGDLVCSLFVAPGQSRQEYMWTDLYRDLAQGRVGAIFNVVSFGYHAFEAPYSYKELSAYKEGMSEAAFLAAYAENRRAREMEIMQKLVPRLIDAKGNIWMITLVTKQDLWWHNRYIVKDYYENGAYNSLIQEIQRVRGAHHFSHEYLSASLIMSNFTSPAGELLAPTTAGYDQVTQHIHLQRLLEQVNTFAER